MKNYGLGVGLLLIGLSGQALAITFGPTAKVDGNTYTIGGGVGANGIAVQQIGDTLSFALPGGVAVGANKTMNIEYSVFADPGYNLSTVTQIAGNGFASGTASVGISTSFIGAASETAPSIGYPAGSPFNPVGYSFTSAPSKWDTVKTSVNLNGVGGIAKVSTYSANYTQVVPEPISIAIISSGLAGLVMRRRNKKS